MPSKAVRVSGPSATCAAVEDTASEEIRVCARATEVTSKVSVPPWVPVAVAVTEADDEVAVTPFQSEVLATAEALSNSPLSAVMAAS